MSGHSKWSKVKHKKAGADAKRGVLFSKLSQQLSITAREGGGDPDMNPKLRQIMEQARAAGLPKENIERAVSRATTAAEADKLQDVTYEVYGPGGSAFLIQGLTDNPNRTTNELKHILPEHGGRLAEAGSVEWLFERRGIIEFSPPSNRREEIELALIDNGAEDIKTEAGRIRAVAPPEKLEGLERALIKCGLSPLAARVVMLPKRTVVQSLIECKKARALKETLEEHPDITGVWTNVNGFV